MKKDLLKGWEEVYRMTWDAVPAEALKERAIYKEALSKGVDASLAGLLARMEVFTVAMGGSVAQASQTSLMSVGMQLHHHLNERTAYLARETGRELQRQRKYAPGVGTALWNAAAASTVGQAIGLRVVEQEPFNPIPKAANPHKSDGTPPVVSARFAGIIGPGGTIELATEPKATDAAFLIRMTFAAGSSANNADIACHIAFGSGYQKMPLVLLSTSTVFSPPPFSIVNLTNDGFDIRVNAAIGGAQVFDLSILSAPTFGDPNF